MNRTTKRWLATAAAVVACVGFASRANAATILDTSSSNFLGWLTNPEPSSPSDEAVYIDNLVSVTPGTTQTIEGRDYTRTTNSCGTCPDATGTIASGTTATGDFGTGYTYLLGKYDGPNGGDLVWYVAGLTGAFSIPTNWGPDPNGTQYGLSHWELFTPSGGGTGGQETGPEPASLLLFGAALGAAGLRMRRRVRA